MQDALDYVTSFLWEEEQTPRQKHQAALRSLERDVRRLERDGDRMGDREAALQRRLADRAQAGATRTQLVSIAMDLERARANQAQLGEAKAHLDALRNQLVKSSTAVNVHDVIASITDLMASLPMINDAAGMYALARRSHLQEEMLERFTDMTADMASRDTDTSSAEQLVDELLERAADQAALDLPGAPGPGGPAPPTQDPIRVAVRGAARPSPTRP